MSILDDDKVRAALCLAWEESRPGTADAHEEGGFVLRNADGSLSVERWPKGQQDQIVVPSYPGGKRGNLPIVATFHTHPNLGPDYQQEPPTDTRTVRDDAELKHSDYQGEYVISAAQVYLIRKDGTVETVGITTALLRSLAPDQNP